MKGKHFEIIYALAFALLMLCLYMFNFVLVMDEKEESTFETLTHENKDLNEAYQEKIIDRLALFESLAEENQETGVLILSQMESSLGALYVKEGLTYKASKESFMEEPSYEKCQALGVGFLETNPFIQDSLAYQQQVEDGYLMLFYNSKAFFSSKDCNFCIIDSALKAEYLSTQYLNAFRFYERLETNKSVHHMFTVLEESGEFQGTIDFTGKKKFVCATSIDGYYAITFVDAPSFLSLCKANWHPLILSFLFLILMTLLVYFYGRSYYSYLRRSRADLKLIDFLSNSYFLGYVEYSVPDMNILYCSKELYEKIGRKKNLASFFEDYEYQLHQNQIQKLSGDIMPFELEYKLNTKLYGQIHVREKAYYDRSLKRIKATLFNESILDDYYEKIDHVETLLKEMDCAIGCGLIVAELETGHIVFVNEAFLESFALTQEVFYQLTDQNIHNIEVVEKKILEHERRYHLENHLHQSYRYTMILNHQERKMSETVRMFENTDGSKLMFVTLVDCNRL